MVDKPGGSGDWGAAQAAPALPSIEETSTAMIKGEAPSAEVQRALADNPTQVVTSQPTSAPPVPVKKNWSGLPDWDKPRNESGQFVSKSEGELRAQWDREGGLAHVAETVMRKEAVMYSVAPSLEGKVTEHLDKGFLMKAADHLRLSPGYGPEGFWRSVAQFEDSLSPSERDAWARFCRSLNEDEQAALLWGMSK
jgi:hypothetical protein